MIFLGKEIHEQRDYSEKAAEAIDKEIATIINEGIKKVKNILNKDRKYLDEIAKRLIEKETIERKEFEAIFKNKEK